MWKNVAIGALSALLASATLGAANYLTSGSLVRFLGGATVADVDEIDERTNDLSYRLTADTVKECRVCFQETEGSDQCGGERTACSGWAGPNLPEATWSPAFRDDTDRRAGGCKYQWRLECRSGSTPPQQ